MCFLWHDDILSATLIFGAKKKMKSSFVKIFSLFGKYLKTKRIGLFIATVPPKTVVSTLVDIKASSYIMDRFKKIKIFFYLISNKTLLELVQN